MKNITYIASLCVLLSLVSSCSVISGIFQAGMGFGIFLVILVIVVIVAIIMRAGKK
jgi:hypothetical protein